MYDGTQEHIFADLEWFTGIGCDAKVALDIHNLREENPEMFYNQVTLDIAETMKCFIFPREFFI